VAALQWVKTNIAAFSGDPNNISIMGQQAGGASVHYHLLSPLSRGLFNRAVSMSGTALCWWASIKRPLEKTKKLARLVKCAYNKYNDSDQPEELQSLVDCLRSKEMDVLMNTHPNFYEWRHLQQCQEPLTSFSPRVDPESSMPFMPVEPIDLMKEGNFQHVPWIVGLTDEEGAFKASAMFHDMNSLDEFQDQFEKLGPLMFGFHDGQCEAPKIQAQRVNRIYLVNLIIFCYIIYMYLLSSTH
jgi:carboxylesterase type B